MGKIPIKFYGGVKFIEPEWQNCALCVHPTMSLGSQGLMPKNDGLYAVTSKKTGQQVLTARTMKEAKEFAEKWGETIGRILDEMAALDKAVAQEMADIAALTSSAEVTVEIEE